MASTSVVAEAKLTSASAYRAATFVYSNTRHVRGVPVRLDPGGLISYIHEHTRLAVMGAVTVWTVAIDNTASRRCWRGAMRCGGGGTGHPNCWQRV